VLAGTLKLTVLDLYELEVLFPCLWSQLLHLTVVLIPAVVTLMTNVLCSTSAGTNNVIPFQNNVFIYRILG